MKKKIRKILLAVTIVVFISIGTLTGLGYVEYKSQYNQVTVTKKVDQLKENENYVTYEEMPIRLIQAVVAVEDRRFYQRDSAFDVQAFGRAMWVNLTTFSLREGASTLQQQVAKNLYWDYQTNPIQKMAQMFMMFEVDESLSRNQVIEVYLNIVYFGDGYTGIYQASQGYFGKMPAELTDAEATLLAGLPQAPSIYQLSSGMEQAKERQLHVLEWMVSESYMTQKEADDIYNTPIILV